MAEKYLSLDDLSRERYLEKEGVIILDIVENEDNTHNWSMDICEKYSKFLEEFRKENGFSSIDETFAHIIETYTKNASKKDK